MSPWMNTADVATYLRYTGKHPRLSVYKFLKRHGIVCRRDGRRLLVARADVERAISLRTVRTSAVHTGESLPDSISTVTPEKGVSL